MELPKKLTLQVVTPERDVAHDEVDFVQMPALDGFIGVLPGHAPLLTELGTGVLTYRSGGKEHFAAVSHGFAEVLPDRVILLAEVAELGETIDVARAEAAQERALRVLQQKAEQIDFQAAQMALERSLVRIQAAKLAGMNIPGVKHRQRPEGFQAAGSHEKK